MAIVRMTYFEKGIANLVCSCLIFVLELHEAITTMTSDVHLA